MNNGEGRCKCEEIIIRGITSVQLDQGKASPDLFSGKASVNRLAVTGLSKSIEIFKHNLVNPDRGVTFRGYVCLSIHEMVSVISTFIRGNKGSKDKNATVWVLEDPDENPSDSRQVANPGHAIVVPKVTDGMSSKLVKHLNDRMTIFAKPL